MANARTVLLVDDQALFRAGLAQVIGSADGFVVVGEAATTTEAIALVLEGSPDIVLLDLGLRHPDGLDPCALIKRASAATSVVIMATTDDDELLFGAIKAGAAAFVLKSVSPAELLGIMASVVAGEYLINDKLFTKPTVAERVLSEFRQISSWGDSGKYFAPLSSRELEILNKIAEGMTNKQVAWELGISEQTVKNHMSSILRKLSVNDRTQAVVFAMRKGWIKMPGI